MLNIGGQVIRARAKSPGVCQKSGLVEGTEAWWGWERFSGGDDAVDFTPDYGERC